MTPAYSRVQVLLALAVGLVFSAQILLRLAPLNPAVGWRDLGLSAAGVAMLLPLLGIGWVVWILEKGRQAQWLLLGLLVLCNFALQVAGLLIDPRGARLIPDIILSPKATSYFSDALQIHGLADWLARFHHATLAGFHAGTHPPGPILFCWVFIRLFGTATGAWVCAGAMGLAGAAGVYVIHGLAGLWTADPKARLLASALYATVPALVVFFPEFDQGYAVLSMLLMIYWAKSLGTVESAGGMRYAALFGGVLFVASFFSYQILAVGTFLAFYGVYWLWREGASRAAIRKLLLAAAVGLGVCVAVYVALGLTTGFNAPAALRHAIEQDRLWLAGSPAAPFLTYVNYNLYTFALGLGVMVVVIALLHAFRAFDGYRKSMGDDLPLTLIGFATLLAIDVTGLFTSETDRVWLFLAPLIVVPAAIELARMPWKWRILVFAVQGWILVCIRAKITFIEP